MPDSPAPNEPPHAVDAERAILGALLVDNNALDDIADSEPSARLSADMFYDARHVALFSTMAELHLRGSFDALVLAQHLVETGKLDTAGGGDYIADLAVIGAHPTNLPAYVELVYNTALLRATIKALNDNLRAAHSPAGKAPKTVLDEAESRLISVGDRFLAQQDQLQKIEDIATPYFNRITQMVQSKNFDALMGLPSGYTGLDRLTTGLHGGDLLILAGRPGTGKTAFSLNILRHVTAADNIGAVFFSLEMQAEQLVERMLSYHDVNLRSLALRKNMERAELQRLSESVSDLENRGIRIDDSPNLSILSARAQARRAKRKLAREGLQLGLVVVDYLQIMEGDSAADARESRATEVSAISRGLKSLAKELNVPVLALAQLNRNIETRSKDHTRPMLSDLRESGAIEQDADLVMFLHQTNADVPSTPPQDVVDIKLIIGKQRNGPTGDVNLVFNKPSSKFTEAPHDYQSAPGYAAGAAGASGYGGQSTRTPAGSASGGVPDNF